MEWIGFALAGVIAAALVFFYIRSRQKILAIEKTASALSDAVDERSKNEREMQAAAALKEQAQQAAQNALAEVNALIDQLIQNSPDGIGILDDSMKVVRANALATGMVTRFKESGSFDLDGRRFDVKLSKLPKGYLYVVRDRTEETQSRQQIEDERRMRAKVEQAQARAAFLADAGAALIPTADLEATADRAIRLAVPRLAEGCRVSVGDVKAAIGSEEYSLRVPVPGGVMEFAAPKDKALAEDLARLVSASIKNAQGLEEGILAQLARDELIKGALAQVRTKASPFNVQAQTVDKLLMKGDVPSYQTKLIGTPRRHTALLLKMVEDILESASMGAEKLSVNVEEVDLAELILDIADGYKQHFASASCPVEFKVVGPIKGKWDWLRIEQAIANLMTYAIQTGASCPVRFLVKHDPGKVDIELHHYLNDAAAPGAALALQMTRRIIEAHRGTLRVENEGGVKQAILIQLPR
jgi:signal transduction histidine kinase